ncbi:MAG TPA: AAA family ATPase [Trebonia sp.]|jgi:DNA-binding CsgD family transcriptional regulator/tetratricopeptide (TPR) repeat protein
MSPVTAASALVGRDHELALLDGLLREAARGRGDAVLIEGEPGIGKSALTRAAVAITRDAGCQLFWGAGDELGTALPLLPFLDALQVREPSANARRKAIAGLARGEIAAGRSADVPAALAEQLLALVSEESAVRPVVLVVDDLQWADRASVTLWGRLARTARQSPLLLVGMARPVPYRDDVVALRRLVGDARRLQLSGLAEPAVADLLTVLAGGKPDGSLLQLAGGAAGNPLYLTDLVTSLVRSSNLNVTAAGTAMLAGGVGPAATERGAPAVADGASPAPGAPETDIPAGGSLPAGLSAVIADRLDFLAGPVRDVLRAAALLGADFEISDLAVVLGRSVPGLLPALDEARAAGLLAESGGVLGFRHPLIRAALYDEMPAPVRAAWHRDAARALAEAGAPLDRVARQLLGAVGRRGGGAEDDWMLDWLASTSDRLISQAPGVAAELLTWAVASAPLGTAKHELLASRLADALYRSGDTARAEQVAYQALEYTTDPDLRVDLHWTLVQCLLVRGASAESLATLDRALAAPGISIRHRARLLTVAARTHVTLGDADNASRVATSALAAASEAGDNWATGWALHVLTMVTGMQGQMSEGLPLFDRALAATQADRALTDLRLLVQVNKAILLGHLDRHEEALAVAAQARSLADQVGTAIRLAQAHDALGQLLFQTGRWDDALAEIASVPEKLKEPAVACYEFGVAAVAGFHRGEDQTARRHLAAAAPYAARIGQRLIWPLALAHSLDREREGAAREALAALTGAFAGNMEEIEVDYLLPDAVRLAIRSGDVATATSLAARVAALAEGSEIPHRQANALFCGGLLDHDAGRLVAAGARYAEASRPLLAAKADEAAAVEFVLVDDRSQARDAFVRSVETYTSLGAAADVARLRAAFRAHGIHRGPHSRHRRADSGWDSLTDTEVKIAGLVADGLSNPEIAAKLMLSRRTVSTHVSHILKKLGVASRTDIARESALRTMAAQ